MVCSGVTGRAYQLEIVPFAKIFGEWRVNKKCNLCSPGGKRSAPSEHWLHDLLKAVADGIFLMRVQSDVI